MPSLKTKTTKTKTDPAPVTFAYIEDGKARRLAVPADLCPEGTILDGDRYAVGIADEASGANGLVLEVGVGLVVLAGGLYAAHVKKRAHNNRMAALKGNILIIRTHEGAEYIGCLDWAASDVD